MDSTLSWLLSWRFALSIVMGTLAFWLLLGYARPWPVVLVPVVLGIFSTVVARGRTEALVVVVTSTLAGMAMSYASYQATVVQSLLDHAPAYANPDVVPSMYKDIVLPLMAQNPVNSALGSAASGLALVAIEAAVGAATVLALSQIPALWPRLKATSVRSVSAYICVGLLAASFVFTAWTVTPNLRQKLSAVPVAEQYAFDPYINLKVYYSMLDGKSYYEALVPAVLGDSRVSEGPGGIRDGKFDGGWGGSPWLVRQPEVFYLWRVIAPWGGATILAWSILLAAALLVLTYLTLSRTFSYRALFCPMVLFPGLLLQTTWMNILHPDWWGVLALMFSMLFALRRHWVWAGVLGLAAALFREVLAVWLVLLIAAAAWDCLRTRRWAKTLVPLGAVLVVLGVALALHLSAASRLVHPDALASSVGFVQQYIGRIGLTFAQKNTVAAASYLGFPYGSFRFPLILVMPIGIVGFVLAFRRRMPSLLVTGGWVLFWLVEYVVAGPTSSYWGMHVMPMAYLGCALLPVALMGTAPPEPAVSTGLESKPAA